MELASILHTISTWAEPISMATLCVTIIATIIARLTPSKADDETMSKINKAVLKAVDFLPTIGINPRVKQLEETVKMLNDEKAPDAKAGP